MKILAAAALAAAALSAAPAQAALTFDWYFDITSGDGVGQRITGTITGLEEGTNYVRLGGPIAASVTSAPLARFLGGGYVFPPSDFGEHDGTEPAFRVTDGQVMWASAYMRRDAPDVWNQSEAIFFGGYQRTGWTPGLLAVEADNSSPFYGRAPRGKVFFTPAKAAGVPEPATWALLIAGMGAAGGMLRRRGRVRAAIRFA